MLKRENRLTKRKKLQKTKTLNTPFAVIKISKGVEKNSKFGFIVSKKIDQRAVVRNKTKRRIRTAIEKLLLEVKPGQEILFILKKGAVGIKMEDLYKSLKIIFSKENLLK